MSQNRSRNRRKPQQQHNNYPNEEEENEEEEAPLRYAPLRDFYAATSSVNGTAPLVHVYSRRRPNRTPKPSFFDSLVSRFAHNYDHTALVSVKSEPLEEKEEDEEEEEDEAELMEKEEQKEENKAEKMKRKREELSKKWLRPKRESTSMDADTTELRVQNGNKGRKAENVGRKRKRGASENGPKADGNGVVDSTAKKWVRLSFEGVDPKKFIGLQSKIYWPLDDDWYGGHIVGYNAETGRHQVSYEDGDKENVMLSVEKIKFHISPDEMQRLNLKYSTAAIADGLDFSEMVVLAADFDDDHDLGPGAIIWAKLAGHAVWPAVIVDDSVLVNRKGLNRISEGKSVSVQFFGTHDFARVNVKQVISFLKGLLSSCHLKCKKPNFLQSLEEAKTYLSEQHLPERMLIMQNGEKADNCDFSGQDDEENYNSIEDCNDDKEIRKLDGSRICPIEIGDLRVIRLGSIVKDSKFFQDGKFIWPEGYTAARKFSSIKDPSVHALYKMEVLRDVGSRLRPLFRVTVDGEQFKGSTPAACWNKIYKRIRKIQHNSDDLTNEGSNKRLFDSGSEMFGFSNPEVMKLIKEMSISKISSQSSVCKRISRSSQEVPVGYRPVQVKWKDLDKCSVCDMDEEYEDNLFLQCDRCRIMVHAKCYGELEPVDGILWLCNLCRPGAPKYSPPCCLCPVRGGAMKPTTDGRWAHLACAIWIPETCLLDIKKMEPIDGLSQINKDRWKLLCSICGVSYGACIQCSNNSCRVAYHPLCARVAGFCIEPADENKLHLINMDEDEDKQCIQLHSFCKKHSPPSRERSKAENRSLARTQQVLENIPPSNPSGCARTEPFNFLGRRGRKEPDALAAASLKRLFVEDKPYLVHGFCRHETSVDGLSSAAFSVYKVASNCRNDVPNSIRSMIEKFRYMRTTTRKRLAFGKSGIHGFGIFAKQPHRAGDMVIEYTGELVRPPIADRREHLIYNSLVGAGTYMFRINNERVIDATRAGSIAHLINHSCEPNCYSRVITVNGDEHIIIFAKRDIKQWEELTYDYRFMSIDEQLPCYCGHARCRGVVNDIEAEELVAKLLVPSSELTELRGD